MIAAIILGSVAAAGSDRPGRVFRSLSTDAYEISILRSGRTDVVLADQRPVFMNVFPMIWLEGEEEPQPLPTDGQLTARAGVNTRLGQGQGVLFNKGNCEWIVQAYPTQPYLSAQVAFINTSKKAVRVKVLIPWAAGAPKKGGLSLGAETAQSVILENGHDPVSNSDLPRLAAGDSLSLWNAAAYNPSTKRSLIAGFVSNRRADTQIRFERTAKAASDAFDLFRAECVYDPPVEVPPGQRLESEVVYLSVNEQDPLEGLERFGNSFAAFNEVKRTRPFLPHGWDSWNTKFKTDINEERILAALDFLDRNLKRYGWTHLAIDDGWELAKGNWEPDPSRFPNGMKWLASQIHDRGMTAGIWIDPFTVRMDTPLAQAHPDWLAEPDERGRAMLEKDERILDVTIPGAYAHVRDLFARIGGEWGYDALQECDFIYRLMCAQRYNDPNLTRVEVLRKGMEAIREGFGDRWITAFTPLPIAGIYADAMRIGDDCAPIWRKDPERWPWGCVEAMTNAARRYYFAPHLWAPDPDCAYFGHAGTRARWEVAQRPELAWDQSLAWLTAAALTGGVVKIGDWLPDLNEKEIGVLKRLLPTLRHPARPIDLFERETPCIWSLPIRAPIGEWQIVGVFNWDETAPQTLPIDFARLGLDASAHYTVYDFWQDHFFGLAQDRLEVTTAPASVRLLGLRRYEDHPMFLATDRHFTQGATDFKALTWDAQTRELSGSFEGIADTEYNLRILVPEAYVPRSTEVSAGPAATVQDGKVLKIAFHCAGGGPVNWRVQF